MAGTTSKDGAAPAAPPGGAGAQQAAPAKLWLGLVALALSAMMHGADAMIVTVATPQIGRELNTGLAELTWVTTGYLLAYAATLVTAGKLGDRYGHRTVFLVGMVGFVISSALVGLSQNIDMLVAFRVLQGGFGAMLLPTGLAIVRLTFPEDKLKIAVGVFMGTFAIAGASGPALGGIVVNYLSWRWAFYINVVLGAIAFLMVLALVAPVPPQDRHRRVDIPGMLVLAVALVGLVFAINQAPIHGWGGARTLTGFLLAVVGIAAFVVIERRAPEPLTPPSLLASRNFVAANLILLIGTGLMFALWFYLALFLQNVEGASPLKTGLELLAVPITGMFCAPLGGVLNQKFGPRLPLTIGAVCLLIATYGLSRLAVGDSYPAHVLPFLIPLGITMSFMVPVSIEVVISAAPKNLTGVASGLGETMGSLGPAVGVASVGAAISLLIRHGLPGQLAAAGVPAEVARPVAANSDAIAQGAVLAQPGVPAEVAARVAAVTREAFTNGLGDTLTVALAVPVICLVLVWMLRPAPAPAPATELPASLETAPRLP